MTTQDIVSASSAPFSLAVIPMGMNRPLTAPEVAALNLRYPVPPWGLTYFMPIVAP